MLLSPGPFTIIIGLLLFANYSHIMIIGFLGKGGSGKSTVSTMMTNYFVSQGYSTLAVDADHNMDLSYNLAPDFNGPYIGGSFLPLRNEFGLNDTEPTEGIFTGENPPQPQFSFVRQDNYSSQFTKQLSNNLYIMSAGPQHDLVLHGAHCSHSLAAPLKIYLPLLDLKDNEAVVVDEKASVDAVSTGIPSGFDLAVVVTEPRPQSLRVANQIMEMLNWYEVPHVAVLNKYKDEQDIELFVSHIGSQPFATLNVSTDPTSDKQSSESLEAIVAMAKFQMTQNKSRLERTINKYKKNEEYQTRETS